MKWNTQQGFGGGFSISHSAVTPTWRPALAAFLLCHSRAHLLCLCLKESLFVCFHYNTQWLLGHWSRHFSASWERLKKKSSSIFQGSSLPTSRFVFYSEVLRVVEEMRWDEGSLEGQQSPESFVSSNYLFPICQTGAKKENHEVESKGKDPEY